MTTQERVIAVTGAHGALGQVVVETLLGTGASLIAVDARAHHDNLGATLTLAPLDLTDPEAVQTCVSTIKDQFGALHGLVNIAGGFTWQTFADAGPDTWAKMFALNVTTATSITHALLPLLKASAPSSVVNIGALAAEAPVAAGMGAYVASKAGVHALTESLADELKGEGVRVNAVLPSIIDTQNNRKDMPDADFASWVQPKEVAAAIGFLLSPAASGITGALVPLKGRV